MSDDIVHPAPMRLKAAAWTFRHNAETSKSLQERRMWVRLYRQTRRKMRALEIRL
jgi:hypothetical protein